MLANFYEDLDPTSPIGKYIATFIATRAIKPILEGLANPKLRRLSVLTGRPGSVRSSSADFQAIIHIMPGKPYGYREIEHTADWELEVWAPDLAGLLEQAAQGMYALSGLRFERTQLERRELDLQAEDAEGLLVVFLGELLHFIEQDNLAFDEFQIELNGYALHAHLSGSKVQKIDKEIKAVTYHNLQVRQSGQGL